MTSEFRELEKMFRKLSYGLNNSFTLFPRPLGYAFREGTWTWREKILIDVVQRQGQQPLESRTMKLILGIIVQVYLHTSTYDHEVHSRFRVLETT